MNDDIVYGDFWQVELEDYGILSFPCADYTQAEVVAIYHNYSQTELTDEPEVERVTGYFAEIFPDDDDEAPSNWIGPFDSEEEVQTHLEEILP